MKTLADEFETAVAQALEGLSIGEAYRHYYGRSSDQLEQQLSTLHAGAGVLLTSSGTAAVEIALRAAGIGSGCEVAVSAYDYPGNFWAIERVGARPVLIDVQPNSWQLDLEQLQSLAQEQSAVRSVIASHLHGQFQPIAEIRSLCDRQGWLLIEDNCQALGSALGGTPSGTLGHVGIFSFGGSKTISAGRGGGLATADARLLQRARVAAGAGSGPYGLSELQAAVVLAQLPLLAKLQNEVAEFFNAVDRHVQRLGTEVGRPVWSASDRVMPYQVGWFLTSRCTGDIRDNVLQRLVSTAHLDTATRHDIGARLDVGRGFEGFHRRSERRCRAVARLVHAASISERTIVIHHRQAICDQHPPQALAQLLHEAVHPLAE